MKLPTFRFVFDVKHLATKTNKGLVQIVASSERKRMYINTGIKLYSDQWNEKNHVINSNDSVKLNIILNNYMSMLNSFIIELQENSQSFDFEKLKSYIDPHFFHYIFHNILYYAPLPK